MQRGVNIVAGLAAVGAAAVMAYALLVRPWHVRWGATDEEVDRPLPGDDLLPRSRWGATRAITIQAPPDAVWPWIAQLGQGRGGLYSYDWLENLAGCDIHSADAILPEHQSPAAGDLIRMGPQGYPAFVVQSVDPGHALVLTAVNPETGQVEALPDDPGEPYTAGSWAFVLEDAGPGATRLIVRSRGDSNLGPGNTLMWRIVEGVQFVMEQKMLRGVKLRAESAAPG